MEKQTLGQLEAALDAISKDLAPRVEELAEKSTEGLLTPEDQREYAEIVRGALPPEAPGVARAPLRGA